MSDPQAYEDAQARAWRIRMVQVLDVDPMYDGVGHTFSVEPAEAGATEDGFEVTVRYAPIFFDLLTMAQRRGLRQRSRGLVESLLDRGVDGPAEIRVSSDGAAMVAGDLLEWCLPLRQSA